LLVVVWFPNIPNLIGLPTVVIVSVEFAIIVTPVVGALTVNVGDIANCPSPAVVVTAPGVALYPMYPLGVILNFSTPPISKEKAPSVALGSPDITSDAADVDDLRSTSLQ
jgi:hypothetical protein